MNGAEEQQHDEARSVPSSLAMRLNYFMNNVDNEIENDITIEITIYTY